MEAIVIAGVAVVAVGGWYSLLDLLSDAGIRVRKSSRRDRKSSGWCRDSSIAAQRSVKQMAGVNV